MAGFGRAPFGRGPFGRSDTGGDLVVSLFPDDYFNENIPVPAGETAKTNENDPLVQVLNTYANSVYLRRLNIDNLPSIIDPDTARLDLVRLTGDMLGLGIDKNDPDFLQRTFLKTASQWLQIKASTKGYQVRGLASGFAVQVDTFWRVDPSYAPFIPLRFQFFFKPVLADDRAGVILHTDKPPGTFAGTPTTETPLYAKSSYVQAIFSVPIYRPHVDYNTLLNLVILKIRDVVGIHHELLPSIFQVILNVDASKITVTIPQIDENIEVYNFNEADYFDIIPADVMALDQGLRVVYITEEEDENLSVDAVPSISLMCQESVVEGLDVDASNLSALMEINELADILVVEQHYFDAQPADITFLDNVITVTIIEGLGQTFGIQCNITTDILTCQEETDFPSIGVSGNALLIIDEHSEFGMNVSGTVTLQQLSGT